MFELYLSCAMSVMNPKGFVKSFSFSISLHLRCLSHL